MFGEILKNADVLSMNATLSEEIFLGYRKDRVTDILWRSRDLLLAVAKETYPIFNDGEFSMTLHEGHLYFTDGVLEQERKPYHKALVEFLASDFEDASPEIRYRAICSLVAGDIEFKSKYTQRLLHRLCCQQIGLTAVSRTEQELVQLKPNALEYKMVVGSSPPSEHSFASYEQMLETVAECHSTAVIVDTTNGSMYTLLYFNERKIMVYAWEEEN